MFALVFAHVDQAGGGPDGGKGGFDHRLGRSDKGDHRPVGSLARIDVQQFDAFDGFDGIGDLFDDGHIAALAEIGHAFDEWRHSSIRLGLANVGKLWGGMGDEEMRNRGIEELRN